MRISDWSSDVCSSDLSLDPRMRVRDSIAEPIDIAGGFSRKDRADRVAELLEMGGLSASFAERFQHELSGGPRQRTVIARALALDPDSGGCAETGESLDVSRQRTEERRGGKRSGGRGRN